MIATRTKDNLPRLAFLFRSRFDNPGSHLPRFLMAIVSVEVGSHSQQNLVRLFSGIGFGDEQPATGAARPPYRFALFNRFKKLKISGSVAHGNQSRTDTSPANVLH
jgi:hypothetical protein